MKHAVAVSNTLVEMAERDGRSLTAQQILKLTYLAHGWMMALYNRHLLKESVAAWEYGPIVPDLYKAVIQFRSHPVEVLSDAGEPLDDLERDLVQQVYDRYGHLSGPALSRLTNGKGTPWAFTHSQGSFGRTISNDIIMDYFQRLAYVPQAV